MDLFAYEGGKQVVGAVEDGLGVVGSTDVHTNFAAFVHGGKSLLHHVGNIGGGSEK